MKEKDICDIIIENVIKEWHISVSNAKDEKWEQPLYSKKKIEKAGKILVNKDSSQEEINQALVILNNWRSSHAYPLKIITDKLIRDNSHAIVVQRLKRLDSIIGKVERFPQMSLYKMQDLGGCRVILNSIEQVYESVSNYKSSHVLHVLKKENDYIQSPKTSGYRSYHMVYQFKSKSNDTYNKNMLIEIQLRTQLQHLWATALETMGIYTQTNLKSSIGDENVLRFFVLVSSLFALKEGTPVCPNTSDNSNEIISELKDINKKLNIISTLRAIAVAADYIGGFPKEKKGYHLLLLDFVEKKVKVHSFSMNQIEAATKAYNQIEIENFSNINAVLVSASTLDNLKEAYPNYFADMKQFVNMMRKILKDT